MFTAEKGEGAWMNDRRLRVSARREPTQMLFATRHLPFGTRDGLPELMQEFARLLPASAGIRRLGVASLDLAYVAAGRVDGFWERGLHPWDIAAGMLLVREAGGLVGRVGERCARRGSPLPTGDNPGRQPRRLPGAGAPTPARN